ncbi:MAG: hypothetical protein WC998_08860 [Candidatus Paceibacterota bacterium]|jgi:hypothetical protein
MNVIELKKMICAFLKTKTANVYPYDSVPQNAVLPYTTYSLDSGFPDENRKMERFTLLVDNWDNNSDTTALETVTGSIDGDGDKVSATGLNEKKYFVSGTLQASFYREGRFEVPDEDPSIKRRQLRYEVQVYLT